MTDVLVVRLRRELAYMKRENAALRKDRDKALQQWTVEHTQRITERRVLRSQIRELEKVLYRYLDGQEIGIT